LFSQHATPHSGPLADGDVHRDPKTRGNIDADCDSLSYVDSAAYLYFDADAYPYAKRCA
jgi:hypothetical protein